MSLLTFKNFSFLIFVLFQAPNVYSMVLAENKVLVDLKQSVYVIASAISLRDVADLSYVLDENKAKVIDELNNIIIGAAPKPGVPVFVTKNRIAALIKKENLIKQENITWGNESIVKVNSHGELLKREKIVSVAEQYFKNLLVEKYPEYDIEQVGVVKDKVIRQGELRLEPVFDIGRNISARNCIWVEVYVDNVLQSTVHVWFKTKVFDDALIAMQSFRQHDYLQPEKLMRKRIDVAGVEGDLLKIENVSASYRYTKSINENDIITYESIESAPLIEKGSVVIVTAQVGKVMIKNKAIAMSDGEMFEKIMVHNRTNRNIYTVVVTGDQEVAINVK